MPETWARPVPPREVPPPHDPSEDPTWGELREPCRDCKRLTHEAMCPTAIEQDARRESSAWLIELRAGAFRPEPYDPRDYWRAWADTLEDAEPPEAWLRTPSRWPEHYRAVADRIAEILPERLPEQLPPDRVKGFLDYLAAPNRDGFSLPAQPRRIVRRKKHHGPKLFDDRELDGLGDKA